MKTLGVIPSRINSTRVPRKALSDIAGLPMCVHVYRRARLSSALDRVVIATDSREIESVAQYHGAEVIMTSPEHRTPTDRVRETALATTAETIVQINGDEPLLTPEHIDVSVDALIKSGADASVLARKFTQRNSASDFKLVLDTSGHVMYVSRSDIPHTGDMLKAYHIMSFTRAMLEQFPSLYKAHCEHQEGHELLRLLEHGHRVKAAVVKSNSISVDITADLEYVRQQMQTDPLFAQYR